jgi:hypothetical protein
MHYTMGIKQNGTALFHCFPTFCILKFAASPLFGLYGCLLRYFPLLLGVLFPFPGESCFQQG